MENFSSSPSPLPASSSTFRLWGRSWQEKLPAIIVGLVIIIIVASILISRGILKTSFRPQGRGTQQLTDEQKLQILKNLSSGSSGSQLTDKQKLQTMQKLSQPQKNASQPSDADKLKILQQLSGK